MVLWAQVQRSLIKLSSFPSCLLGILLRVSSQRQAQRQHHAIQEGPHPTYRLRIYVPVIPWQQPRLRASPLQINLRLHRPARGARFRSV